MGTQLRWVGSVMRCRAESCNHLSGIIFAAVKTTVSALLQTSAQRLQERHHNQGRDDHRGYIGLADQTMRYSAKYQHKANVNKYQNNRQRAIHERTIDEYVDIPEAI